MWSFEIMNIKTGDRTIIFGYSFEDAIKRACLKEEDWTEIRRDYED